MINFNTARRIAGIGGGSGILGAGYSTITRRRGGGGREDRSSLPVAVGTGFLVGGTLGTGGAYAGYIGTVAKAKWDRGNKSLARKIFSKKPQTISELIDLKNRPREYGVNTILGTESPLKFKGVGSFRDKPVYLDTTPYLNQNKIKFPHAMAALETHKQSGLKEGIYLSPKFVNMEKRYQDAVLFHEAQHLEGNHINRFISRHPITNEAMPQSLRQSWLAETDADQGAVRAGYGTEIKDFLRGILGTKANIPWYNKAIITGRALKLSRHL